MHGSGNLSGWLGLNLATFCRKVTCGGLKYSLSSNYRHGHLDFPRRSQRILGMAQDILRVKCSWKLVSTIDSYNATVRSALSFFTRSKIQVRVLARGSPPPDILQSLYPIVWPGTMGEPPEVNIQSIMVKALNNTIDDLGAKASFDNTEPTHLSWGMTRSTLDTATGREIISQSPRYVKLVKGDEVPVWIWCAWRIKGGQKGMEQLLLNMDPPRQFRLRDMKEPKLIDIDIEFTPVDDKPRKFTLNAKSWDDLGLSES